MSTKDIFLLVIENSLENNVSSLKDDHILIVHHDTVSDDKKHPYDRTMGNKIHNSKVFKKIKLKTTLYEKIKRALFIFCIMIVNLLPNRTLRTIAKQKLNMFFYHAKL